ncbi:MAG: hypothetical protein M3162_04005 [Thermoproteota archaeon]|nr:hypothetical protein [Thermoproteota archaeon]
MKKVTSTNLSILLVFVLASAVFSVSGNAFAQDNTGTGGNGETGDANSNVNPLTGTTDPQQEVAQNFTEFTNATTPQDVQQQQAPIEGSQANLSGTTTGNATAGANTTTQNTTD